MVYIIYHRGEHKIKGFSEERPARGDFFEISMENARDLVSLCNERDYMFIIHDKRHGSKMGPSNTVFPGQDFINMHRGLTEILEKATFNTVEAKRDLNNLYEKSA